MKLYSWNVNGIRAVWNKGLFQKFIAEHDPDILCIQETKAMAHQSPVEGMDQYYKYYNSAERAGHFGTAIFSKARPLNVFSGFSTELSTKYNFPDSFGDPSKEGRVITAEYDEYYVVTVYTPNSKDKLERIPLRHDVWDPAFLVHVASLQKPLTQHFQSCNLDIAIEPSTVEISGGKPVLFSGDFNVAHMPIDLARPKENMKKHGFTPEEREGFDNMIAAGFVDTLRTKYPDTPELYTWWTNWGGARERNVGWRIDYWMDSPKLNDRIIEAHIHPEVMGSDHCPVSIEIK